MLLWCSWKSHVMWLMTHFKVTNYKWPSRLPLWEHQCMVTTAFLKTETSDHVFYKLLQEILAFVSLPNIILSKLESPPLLITPQRQRRFVVAAGYERFDWQVLDSSCWVECKKVSVGDCRWSLDNIRWPLRAAEISLHGATLLLLSCLDTFFFPPSLLSIFPSLFLSLCVCWVEFLRVGSLYLILR